ncbi:MAG: IS110 family transposase [Streptosporangiales bacterium]
MVFQRTSVGLDVHARSVTAAAIDGQTGEVHRRRMSPEHAEILRWVGSLPGPVKITYEAGPTGFGLARTLAAAGVECVIAAPSKLQRPAGDRVKTDKSDALHLARLLHLGEIVAVTVPDTETEAARDLVRAREDVRGDLMSARHRVSKLLLRQGIVYYGGKPWTGKHQAWLGSQRFEQPALQLAFDAALEQMLLTATRRDRLDAAIEQMAADSAFTPVVNRLGCLRGVSTLTAFGLAVEIGDWHRLTGRSIGAYLGLVPQRVLLRRHPVPGRDHQDRQRPRPAAADRGILAPPPALPRPHREYPSPLGRRQPCRHRPRPRRQPAAARTLAGIRPAQETPGSRRRRDRPRTRRLVLVPGRPRRPTPVASHRRTQTSDQ